MRVLIFGCGYLGRRAAKLWSAQGNEVFAVTRRRGARDDVSRLGATPIVADVTDAASLVALPECDVALFAVGYDRDSTQSIGDVYAGGAANVAAALAPTLKKFLYISSTGVYGPGDGGVVDEQTECRPQREGGKACWAAEQALAASPLADRTIVLRLAGIYGPGRLPRVEPLLRGEPLAVDPDAYLNLIHVDDAARVVLAVAAQTAPPEMFVVSDGRPVRRRDYLQELASLAGAPPPVFASEGPTATSRGGDKRASNRKLTQQLSLAWRYPSYREGLRHALSNR